MYGQVDKNTLWTENARIYSFLDKIASTHKIGKPLGYCWVVPTSGGFGAGSGGVLACFLCLCVLATISGGGGIGFHLGFVGIVVGGRGWVAGVGLLGVNRG